MKEFLLRSVGVCALALSAGVAAYSQDQAAPNGSSPSTQAESSGPNAAKIPVVIVGSAAKATWVTTKFAAKHVAKPVAKAVVVKAGPAVGKFALKNSAKYLLPFVVKLSVL
jgi:hypothetical protein